MHSDGEILLQFHRLTKLYTVLRIVAWAGRHLYPQSGGYYDEDLDPWLL